MPRREGEDDQQMQNLEQPLVPPEANAPTQRPLNIEARAANRHRIDWDQVRVGTPTAEQQRSLRDRVLHPGPELSCCFGTFCCLLSVGGSCGGAAVLFFPELLKVSTVVACGVGVPSTLGGLGAAALSLFYLHQTPFLSRTPPNVQDNATQTTVTGTPLGDNPEQRAQAVERPPSPYGYGTARYEEKDNSTKAVRPPTPKMK